MGWIFARCLLFSIVFLSSIGCTKKTSEASTVVDTGHLTLLRAIGSTALTKSTLATYKSQLETIGQPHFSGEAATLVSQILAAYPLDPVQLRIRIDETIATATGKVSEEKIQRLRELATTLLGATETRGAARPLGGTTTIGALPHFLQNIGSFSVGSIADLIDAINGLRDLLEQLDDLLNDIQNDIMGGPSGTPAPNPINNYRYFGPTSCPNVLRDAPSGYVQEGPTTSCGLFTRLKQCMKEDKARECTSRCVAPPPQGLRCNPLAGEVLEVDCHNNPPPEWAATCASLGGNTTATCRTPAATVQDNFPVGFWVCKNLPYVVDPLNCPPPSVSNYDGTACVGGCPAGSNYDPQLRVCVCTGGRQLLNGACVCPAPRNWDPAANQCTCPAGMINGAAGTCMCAPPMEPNASGTACVGGCPAGSNYDPQLRVCVCTGGRQLLNGACVCPAPRNWDPAANQCTCPAGMINGAAGTCMCAPPMEPNASGTACVGGCPAGSNYDPQLRVCVCTGGRQLLNGACVCPAPRNWDPAANQCTCPAGMINGAAGTCMCAPPMEPNASGTACVGGCPAGSNYDPQLRACVCTGGRQLLNGACVCPTPTSWNIAANQCN